MELLPSYKQQRDETPDDLEAQFPVIEEAVSALGVRNVSLERHEADDVIASYVAAARKLKAQVVIATNDKDIYSLVGEGVEVYSTNKTDLKNPTDGFALLGPSEVEEKWGVPPRQIPDVLALTGDSADNIPGVEGVGPKTAAKLVREHGSVSLLAENPSVIANEKLRAKISACGDRVRDNLELVRLEHDLPLPVALDSLGIVPDPAAVVALAKKCEFRSLLGEYEKLAKASGSSAQGELF